MANERVKNDTRLLKRALSATQNGVMITDATEPDDPIVYVNRAFERITGYASEEVIGRNPRFLQAGDSDQPALDDLRAFREGNDDDAEWTGVLRNYRKDGTPFYNELATADMRDEGGCVTHHIGLVTDVTEREEAEEGLRKNEARLAEAQRLAHLGSWEWDVATGEVSWSDEVYRIYGYAPGEFVPTLGRLVEAVHPDDWGLLEEKLAGALRRGEPYDFEHRILRPDGEVRVVHRRAEVERDEAGEPLRMVGTVHDVTERKLAEAALRESEARFRVLAQNASDIISVLGADGTVRYQSRALERVLGYEPEEMVGTNAFEHLHPDDAAGVRDTLAEMVADGAPTAAARFRYRHADGSWRHVEALGRNLLADPGVEGVVVTSRDVTERVRAEEALKESERRFRSVLRYSSDVVMILDTDATIRYQSQAVERVLGYRPEELVGGSAFEYLHPEDAERTSEEFGRIVEDPGLHEPVEYRFRHKDGSWRWFEGIGSNLLSDPAVGGIVVNSRDVTERKRAEEALRLRDRAIAESKDGVVITGPNGQDQPMVYVNRGFERMTGYAADELLGRNCRMLQGPERNQPALGELRAALGEGREWSGILRNYRKDGTPFWNELSVSPVRDGRGGITHFVGMMNDVTGRKELEERLEHQAFHDSLTGLPNRALLADRLTHALARTERSGRSVAVLFLDLDDFKYVNDSLGHDAGDQLLVEAARRLEGCVRPEDTVARLGGDEFALLLEGARDAVEARRVAERAVEALGQPFDLGEAGREVFSGASVGIALGDGGVARDLPKDLLRKADLALYEAKREGKARHAVFDPETERRSMRRLELENGLRRAVERDEIVVRYQPVVCLSTGLIAGFEALARWQHPERGLLEPDEFVPLAEETGLIVPLGERVLREACRQAKAWQERHPSDPPLVVGVNLSARQLSHPDLVGGVEAILRETGLDPGRLTLEITESALVEDAERHAGALRGLKDLGVRFAIDDFGTGYSSLSYLRRLPAGLLKVDGSFVEGIGRGAEEDEVVLSGVIGIAHGLGLTVCAEGVEAPEQASRLRELECDLAQGNHFSAPLTGEEASRFLPSSARG